MQVQISDPSLDYTLQLPAEVLVEIFKVCPREDSTFNPSSTLWTLGQVCGRWRQVSTNTPIIWTSICMNMLWLYGISPQIPATSVLSTILERSRDHLLEIQLVFHPELGEAQRLFDLLCNESERWATFKFSLPGNSGTVFNASAVANLSIRPNLPSSSSFAALREVDVNRLSELPGGLALLAALAQSPCLRKLVLVDVKYVGKLFARIPWSQLTHFEVNDNERFRGWLRRTGYPLWFCAEVLFKSPNLEVLRTWKWSWTKCLPIEPRERGADSSIYIVELDLYGWAPGPARPDDMDVLSLRLPSLRHLTLRELGGSSLNDLDSIIKMVERSSCRLFSVSLFDATFLDVTVKRLLSISRGSLRKIVLRGRIIGSTLLEHFFSHSSKTEDNYPFFPYLEELDADRLMLADLGPYDRVLGLEMPFSMARFHRQLSIHVVVAKNSVTFLTMPVLNETELLQELGMVLVAGHSANTPFGITIENLPVADCILTYLEKYHGSRQSVVQHATTKLGTLRCYLRAIGISWGGIPGQEVFRLAERARLLFDPLGEVDWRI
ncbi:hypothetical protein PQX77_009957 [Marasmius sp. AFHP31]|nr:hypothetical protein PQX77_009957 [Marasmius sp. AFHP31]